MKSCYIQYMSNVSVRNLRPSMEEDLCQLPGPITEESVCRHLYHRFERHQYHVRHQISDYCAFVTSLVVLLTLLHSFMTAVMSLLPQHYVTHLHIL